MQKYTHFKYAITRKFNLKHYRKTIFKKYNSIHEDSKEKETKIDYIYLFFNNIFECFSQYRGYISSHRKELDF